MVLVEEAFIPSGSAAELKSDSNSVALSLGDSNSAASSVCVRSLK